MRPLGLSLHPVDNVITFQYSIQRYSNATDTDEFETKELRIKVPSITKDNDMHLLAQKIVKSKSIIPEIVNRPSLDNKNRNRHDDSIDRKVQEIEQLYHEFYGSNEEIRIMASRKLFKLCLQIENIEVIEKKYQLISVLSRILKDGKHCSIQLLCNVIKVFGVLSGFDHLHPILAEYQVGSSALHLLELETTLNIDEKYDSFNTRQKDVINCTCICILLNLADDFVVRTKMMKNGIILSLKACLILEQPKVSKWMTLHLLYRLSIFGETSETFSDVTGRRLLEYMMPESEEVCIERPYLIPRILFNLSFNKKCREAIQSDNCLHSITKWIINHETSEPVLHLLFNLSLDKSFHSQFDENQDLLQLLTHSITCDHDPKESLHTIITILANLSILPKWAESLVAHIGLFLDRIRSKNDYSSAVVIFNLSKWTYNIQENIRNAVGEVTPSTGCSKQSTSRMNIEEQYWGENIHTVVDTLVCSVYTNKEIATLMARTLSYFTDHDLPLNSSWSDLDSRHSLFDTFSEYIASKECDLTLAGAICSVLNNITICSKVSSVSLLNETILKNLCQCGRNRNGRADPILHRELINLFQMLLLESEFIKIIKSFKELFMEEIYIASQTGSTANKNIALTCLDHIIFHRERFQEMYTMAVYTRFRIWNPKWIENTNRVGV
jgi:hypothetical protein